MEANKKKKKKNPKVKSMRNLFKISPNKNLRPANSICDYYFKIRKTYNIHDIYVFQSWMNQSTRSQQHLKYSGGWTFTSISLTCSFMRTGPMKSLTSPRDFLLVTSGQPQSLLVYSHRWLRTHTSRHRFPPASSERSFSSQISQQFVPKSITNAVGTWRCVRERGSRPSG